MEFNEAIKNLHETLNFLTKEIGVYAINSSWKNEKKLKLQCNEIELDDYLKKNNIEYNYIDGYSAGYETDDYILFTYLGE